MRTNITINALLRRKTIAIAVFLIGVSILLVVTASSPITGAGTSDQALQRRVQVLELDNGMQVVLAPASGSGMSTVNVWVKAGSAQDPPERQGLAHYYEHMVFTQSKQFPGSASDWIESRGGYINATTAHEFTEYHAVIPSEHTMFAVELLADMVTRVAFSNRDLENERNAVLREKGSQQDDPSTRLQVNTRRVLLGASPYAMPVLGTMDSIKLITGSDLVRWAEQHYTPENMTLVVVSDVEQASLLQKIEASFGVIEPKSLSSLTVAGKVTPTIQQQHTLEYSGDLERLAVAWAVPATDDLKELATREVLAYLLGIELEHEDAVTYVASDWSYSPGMILVELEFPSHVDSGDVLDEILSDLESLLRGNVYREHVALAKSWLKDDWLSNRKFGVWFADQVGHSAVVTGDPMNAFAYLDHVESVGKRQLVAMAKEHLAIDRYLEFRLVASDEGPTGIVPVATHVGSQGRLWETFHVMDDDIWFVMTEFGTRLLMRFMHLTAWIWSNLWTVPLGGANFVEAEDYFLLDNGVRILLLPETSTDFVEVHVLVGSGVGVESAGKAGISSFTGGLLTYPLRFNHIGFDHFGMQSATDVRRYFDATGLILRTTSTSWPAALPPFLKHIVTPMWSDWHLDSHREEVVDKIRARDEEPFTVGRLQLRASLYGDGGYANPRTGTMESVSSFAAGEMARFHERFYVPDNIVIAVAGNFDPKMMVAMLGRLVGRMQPSAAKRGLNPGSPAPEAPKVISTDWEGIQLAWVMIGLPGPGRASDDYATLRVFNSVMGSGSSSRLFSHFREQEGDVYIAYSYVRGLKHGSFMNMYAQVLPEDRVKFVEDTLAEVQAIAKDGISQEELQLAIAREVGDQLRFREWIGDKAVSRGLDILYDTGHYVDHGLMQHIENVSVEDVRSLAGQMLEQYHVSEIVPADGP